MGIHAGGKMATGLKVIFVDDERYVREQVCSSIDWKALGMELVGNCSNAVEALDVMIDELPDILITDIKMPIVDGLELIEKTRKMNPSIQCIILSGFAEFALAQSAIEKGVQNYLLKPFSETELRDALIKCRQQIYDERAGGHMSIEQRSQTVLRLGNELQSLIEKKEGITIETLKELMHFYPDISLLRDAAILLIAYNQQEFHVDEILMLFECSENILEHMVEFLNHIPKVVKTESDMVSLIKKYTQEHYKNEKLNLQFVADEIIHLGVKYVGRIFLRETGIKFSMYLLQVRMEKAMKMFNQSSYYSVGEVAKEVGFGSDASYFYQQFKKYTGMTPKEYQKRYQN